MRIFIFFLLLCFLPSMFGLTVPYRKGAPVMDGSAEEAFWESVPWNGPFFRLGSREPAAVQTKFKTAHNGSRIFFLIHCDEPNPAGLKKETSGMADSARRWMDDSVEINLVTDPRILSFFKCTVNSTGDRTESNLIDNNTGTASYFGSKTGDFCESRSLVSPEKGAWTVEFSAPFAALPFNESGNIEWRINVGRNRYADGKAEYSSSSALSKQSHVMPFEFEKASLEKDSSQKYLLFPSADVRKTFASAKDGFSAEASFSASNKTGAMLLGRLEAVLYKNGKRMDSSSREMEIPKGGFAETLLPLRFPENGTYDVEYILSDMTGKSRVMRRFRTELNYRPVEIQVLSPFYRNCFFKTMPEKVFSAEIVCGGMDSGLLAASLTGPDGKKVWEGTLNLSKGKSLFRHDFSGLPDGDYLFSAGIPGKTQDASSSVRLRKLPYQKGEVWLNREGVLHIDGKPFIPVGWFHGGLLREKPWMNTNMDYVKIYPPEENLKYLDRFLAAGKKSLIMPYSEPAGWYLKIFADGARMGGVTPEQKKLLRKLAETIRSSEGLLAYYMDDEPENREINPRWFQEAREILMETDPYHPCVMLNQEYQAIRRYIKGADITFPDCYPNYAVDKPSNKPLWITSKYASEASSLLPSWFVPQAFCWTRSDSVARPPTFKELRNQVWQALANGSKGIVFYSYADNSQMHLPLILGPDFLAKEIQAFSGIIAGTRMPDELSVTVEPEDAHFQTAVFRSGEDFLLIAVNTSNEKRNVSFRLRTLRPETLRLQSMNRSVRVKNGEFRDEFDPLSVHLYTNCSGKEDTLSVSGIINEIAGLEKERFRPGNLAAIGAVSHSELDKIVDGKVPGMLKVTASSDQSKSLFAHRRNGVLYFLFDGLPPELTTSDLWWGPDRKDAAPSLEIVLPKEFAIGRIVLKTRSAKGKAVLRGGEVFLRSNGVFRKKTDFSNSAEQVEIRFPKERTDSVKLVFTDFERGEKLLCEIEIYEE